MKTCLGGVGRCNFTRFRCWVKPSPHLARCNYSAVSAAAAATSTAAASSTFASAAPDRVLCPIMVGLSTTDKEPVEVTELAAVELHPQTLAEVRRFHTFLRPRFHPQLSEFCTRLTGVTQADVDSSGLPFQRAWSQLHKWISRSETLQRPDLETHPLVLCAWDTSCRVALHEHCARVGLRQQQYQQQQQFLPFGFQRHVHVTVECARCVANTRLGHALTGKTMSLSHAAQFFSAGLENDSGKLATRGQYYATRSSQVFRLIMDLRHKSAEVIALHDILTHAYPTSLSRRDLIAELRRRLPTSVVPLEAVVVHGGQELVRLGYAVAGEGGQLSCQRPRKIPCFYQSSLIPTVRF